MNLHSYHQRSPLLKLDLAMGDRCKRCTTYIVAATGLPFWLPFELPLPVALTIKAG